MRDQPRDGGGTCQWVHGPLKINVGGGDVYFREPAFYKDPTGFVHLRGAIGAVGYPPDGCDSSGEDPDDHIMFVLPQGFRPNATVHLAASSARPQNRPGQPSFIGVRIDPGGAVMIHPDDFGAVTAFFLSLEGLSFSHEVKPGPGAARSVVFSRVALWLRDATPAPKPGFPSDRPLRQAAFLLTPSVHLDNRPLPYCRAYSSADRASNSKPTKLSSPSTQAS